LHIKIIQDAALAVGRRTLWVIFASGREHHPFGESVPEGAFFEILERVAFRLQEIAFEDGLHLASERLVIDGDVEFLVDLPDRASKFEEPSTENSPSIIMVLEWIIVG
jgi:hypothetical protein